MEPLLPLLKEAIWKGREMSACRPLMDAKGLGEVPLLAFGYEPAPTPSSSCKRYKLSDAPKKEVAGQFAPASRQMEGGGAPREASSALARSRSCSS